MGDYDKIPLQVVAGPAAKQLGADKMARNTAQFVENAPKLRKPPWIRVR